MKHPFRFLTICLAVCMLLAACKSPKPTPTPTPTSTPTPAAPAASITFEGDQCTYSGPQSIPAGKLVINWIVKDDQHEKYGLVVATLQAGKTFEDMVQWPTADQPPWLNLLGYAEAVPNSQQQKTFQIMDGPIYFVCFYSPPDTKFGVIQPIAVQANTTAETVLPTITPHPAPAKAAQLRPVFIDTDMGWDDTVAILYLLQRTDISVQAITVSGTGLAHCDPGVQRASGLATLAGFADMPVACGREKPLAGEAAFPDDWRSAVDTFFGANVTLPEGKNPAAGKTAVELLTAAISMSPAKVTIIVLGPLTNLADVLQSYPEAKNNIAAIYIMGGAVHVDGNLGAVVSANSTAEWNIYLDPHAAQLVFESGIPITMVPLDATNQVPVTADFYPALTASRLTPEASWVFDLFRGARAHLLSGSECFWDPLTAAILTDENLTTFEQDTLCVVEEAGPQIGQTQVKDGCPQLRVAITVDTIKFEKELLVTLNNP